MQTGAEVFGFLLQHSQCKKICVFIIYAQCLSLVLIQLCRLYCFVTVCKMELKVKDNINE